MGIAGAFIFVCLVLWCIRTFVDPGVPPVTVVEPAAAPDDEAPQAGDPDLAQPPGTDTWTVVGRVRTRRGEPLEGVRVEHDRQRTHTDGEGGFSLGGMSPGLQQVVFWKQGYRLVTRAVVPGREVDVRLRKLVDVEGEVILPGGAPAAGVTVRVIEPDDTETTVVTDAEGRFFARNVGDGRLRFVAEPHVSPAGAFLGTATQGDAVDERPILAVRAGRAVTGVVTDPEGNPYAGAECRAKCYYRQRRSIMATDVSDEEGRFTLVVPAGARTSVIVDTPVAGEGFRYTRWGMSSVEKHEGEIAVDLREGVAIAGRIVAPRGKRVGGLEITAVVGSGHNRSAIASGTVRDDGTFRIGGLWPERAYLLWLEGAIGKNDAYILDGGFAVRPPVADLELRLSVARPFGGVILDPAGKPVPHRTVVVRKDEVGFVESTLTDAEGRFEIPRTAAGELRVVVFKAGRNQGSHDCGTYRSGDTALEIRLPD